MADKKKKKIRFSLQTLLSRWKKVTQILLVVISSKVMHWCIIMVMFAASVWLLYSNMWLPLNQEKGLPPGVSPRNPQIQEEMLRELHVLRAARVQHTDISFINAVNYLRHPAKE